MYVLRTQAGHSARPCSLETFFGIRSSGLWRPVVALQRGTTPYYIRSMYRHGTRWCLKALSSAEIQLDDEARDHEILIQRGCCCWWSQEQPLGPKKRQHACAQGILKFRGLVDHVGRELVDDRFAFLGGDLSLVAS